MLIDKNLILQHHFQLLFSFHFEVPKDTANCGGCTLFGEDFGDHNQAIRIKAYYDEENEAETASQK